MAKIEWTPAATDTKALMQAIMDVIGDSDQDSNDGSTCASCGKDLQNSNDDRLPKCGLCQNKNCRVYVLRKLMRKLAKQNKFSVPGMKGGKYDLPES